VVLPGRDPIEIPSVSRRALTEGGVEVVEEREPSFLFDRSVLVTGEVPRTTGYEPGFPPQQAWLAGRWEPDPLVLDDQALIVDVKDKGLTVITGCGHAGVINMCRYARRLTGDRPLHAVMGGFHLNGPPFEPVCRSSELTRSHPRMARPPITATVAFAVATRAPVSAGTTRTRAPPRPLALIAMLPPIRKARPPSILFSVTPGPVPIRNRIRSASSVS
jgi:hypothetical protein